MNEQPMNQAAAAITEHAYKKLITACQQAYPDEACGVLVQDARNGPLITDVIPIQNASPHRQRHFSFDPAEWIEVYYRIQKNRQTIVGMYHSHPATAAKPSPADLRGALPMDGCSYWIVSLTELNNPSLSCYQISTRNGLIPLMLAKIRV
ncbi:Mov34/MPN/PAD-1 family protein [Paenibacillus sp. GCM10023252]|uniref:Mov34/MPN/PAD-1 family protein n=1 Tax=Paenibacillus sp. GCM10023252 TaxID=3252649 RepID=UPI00360AA17D